MLDYIVQDWGKAGWVLWFIMGVSVWGWTIAFRSLYNLFYNEISYKELKNHIRYPRMLLEWLDDWNPKKQKSVSGAVLMRVYQERKNGENAMLEALDESMKFAIPRMEEGTGTLGVLAATAPLLGLLGTVSGMIQTFVVISRFGTSNPSLMADSISEALLTTQNGLLAAIPLMLLHIFFVNRSIKIEAETTKAAQRLINYTTHQHGEETEETRS
jgi:biopolymer transport protein ExbB/TolQ